MELARVAEAFATGSLSYDKVRFICQVATPQDQEVWVELAQTISGSQLIKICLAYQRAQEADSQERAEAQLARRGLWTFKEDDGMVRLSTPRSRLREDPGDRRAATPASTGWTRKPAGSGVTGSLAICRASGEGRFRLCQPELIIAAHGTGKALRRSWRHTACET